MPVELGQGGADVRVVLPGQLRQQLVPDAVARGPEGLVGGIRSPADPVALRVLGQFLTPIGKQRTQDPLGSSLGNPTQPTDPIIPDPLPVFNFDGYLFGETFESFDRVQDLEEEERRKRAADDPLGDTYYVFDPDTNRYSSYRVFGTPSWLVPVDDLLPSGYITGAGGTINAVGPIEGAAEL